MILTRQCPMVILIDRCGYVAARRSFRIVRLANGVVVTTGIASSQNLSFILKLIRKLRTIPIYIRPSNFLYFESDACCAASQRGAVIFRG